METQAQNIHRFPGFAKGKRAPLNRDAVPFGKFVIQLPTTPLVDPAPALVYPMDGNDTVGDCVVAGWDHFRQVVTQLLTGTGINFTQEQIWAFYQTQNPNFNPATPGVNDNGMCIQTFLEYLQANKYILGFAKIDYTNQQELQAAVYLGLGIMAGVQLQDIQQQQFSSGTWNYVPGNPIDGGHCIMPAGFNNGVIDVVSWGALVNCTPSFITNCMDEAWFVLTQYHVDHPTFRNYFDLAGFSAAVSEITGGQIVIPVPAMSNYSPSFTACSNNTLGWEGGYTNDPNDPGGATNFGISQRSYPNLNIATLTQAQAVQIYYTDFWTPIHGDSMPEAFAMNVFDSALNMGTGAAIKLMQSALGVTADGIIGPVTLGAMKTASTAQIAKFAVLRTMAYTGFSTFGKFGTNWITRTIGTLIKSLTS